MVEIKDKDNIDFVMNHMESVINSVKSDTKREEFLELYRDRKKFYTELLEDIDNFNNAMSFIVDELEKTV
jgi:hypothetical protein